MKEPHTRVSQRRQGCRLPFEASGAEEEIAGPVITYRLSPEEIAARYGPVTPPVRAKQIRDWTRMVKGITMKPRAAEMPRKEDAMAMAGMEFDVSAVAANMKGAALDGPASPEADRWEPRYGITQREWLERYMTADRYRHAKEAGESDRVIMKRLHIGTRAWMAWRRRHPDMAECVQASGPSEPAKPVEIKHGESDRSSHSIRGEIRQLVEEEVSRATLDLRSQIAELRALLRGHRHKVSMQYVSDEPIMGSAGK